MMQIWSEDWYLNIWQVNTMWPLGPSCEETVGTLEASVAPATGVSVCWTGCSEKSNGEVGVGWIGAGEKPESGVEAHSVSNRAMVGSELGVAMRPKPETTNVTSNKKPQNKTSPAAIQSGRLFVFMSQL